LPPPIHGVLLRQVTAGHGRSRQVAANVVAFMPKVHHVHLGQRPTPMDVARMHDQPAM
jgi:hypothetical protein